MGIMAAIFRKGPKPVPPEPVSQQLPLNVDLALRKASFTEVRGGSTIWTIVAERAEYSKKGDIVHLVGVHMKFFRNRNVGSIVVTADTGTYSTKSKNVNLRGKVHVTSDSGIVFDTRSLDYLAYSSHFKTPDTVTFRQKRMTLTAQGMDLDVNKQQVHFFKSIDSAVAGLQHN